MIEVCLFGEDGLVLDDEVWLFVFLLQCLCIVFVGENMFVLQSFMEGMLFELFELLFFVQYVFVVEGGLVWDVVVFFGWMLEVFVFGCYLVFNSLDGFGQLQFFGEVEWVLVCLMCDEYLVFYFVIFDDLFIWMMFKVVIDGNVMVFVEVVEGFVIVEIDQVGVQVIWVVFDLFDLNWWYQWSFVNFVFNVIDYLVMIGGVFVEKGIELGDVILMFFDWGFMNGFVILFDGSVQVVYIDDDGVLSWGLVCWVGIYEVSWSLFDGFEECA